MDRLADADAFRDVAFYFILESVLQGPQILGARAPQPYLDDPVTQSRLPERRARRCSRYVFVSTKAQYDTYRLRSSQRSLARVFGRETFR
jgi:hypothetical protein